MAIPANSLYDLGLFTVTKAVTSSNIKQVAANIMSTFGNGLLIEDVIVTTDGTGLATGTNVVIAANGVTVYAETVANLGANKSVDLAKASVTGVKAFIPGGNKNITIASTAADCTGAGIAYVTIRFRKLDEDAAAQAL